MRISGTTAAAIAASLEKQLHSGLAGADDPLPTVRALAATLRVSPATVAAAYQLLRARGPRRSLFPRPARADIGVRSRPRADGDGCRRAAARGVQAGPRAELPRG